MYAYIVHTYVKSKISLSSAKSFYPKKLQFKSADLCNSRDERYDVNIKYIIQGFLIENFQLKMFAAYDAHTKIYEIQNLNTKHIKAYFRKFYDGKHLKIAVIIRRIIKYERSCSAKFCMKPHTHFDSFEVEPHKMLQAKR